MVKAKKYIFEKQFDGLPKETDLKFVEEELPPIKDGEFLAEAIFLSVLSLRSKSVSRKYFYWITSCKVLVIESKNSEYTVGDHVVGEFGWRTHTVTNGKPLPNGFPGALKVPDPKGVPLSLYLGVLGMPGNTAYFGLLEICQPKAGETVVVSGAAGAVGSLVGQIAKLKGCTVIGIAGSEEKGKWLTNELKFDHFINYKSKDIAKQLKAAAPKGIDCYFDNVGGELSHQVLTQMNLFGRVAVCGAISGYNTKEPKAPLIQSALVTLQLKMEGFIVTRWQKRWFEGITQNRKWLDEGKLNQQETVTVGFENMFKAFVDMLQGGNTGKAIVQV